MAEIDGIVEFGDKKRGKRTIIVRALGAGGEVIQEQEHAVPQGKHMRVHKGDEVISGEALVDGALDPHDILRIRGEEEVLVYLLREVQNVYRSQGVTIDDKHIEIILSQMMRKIQITGAGDSDFLPGAVVDKHSFRRENGRLRKERKKPANGQTLLLGVTKASLSSESFISAASFQETTKVLTEAAIACRRDYLVGLKENVILGHMVPTGTGFRDHYRTRVKKNIDFGELSAAGSMASAADAEMEALLTGGGMAATGSDGLGVSMGAPVPSLPDAMVTGAFASESPITEGEVSITEAEISITEGEISITNVATEDLAETPDLQSVEISPVEAPAAATTPPVVELIEREPEPSSIPSDDSNQDTEEKASE